MAFKVGETVVYPHHGAALIESIETRTIKGEEKLYLVLKVAQGDLTVRVPADNCDLVGVRDVVGQEGLEKVFEVLRALPVHALLLVRAGVPIIELMDLEGLAADGVSAFAFVAAPLRIAGATGSPMRPLALVEV